MATTWQINIFLQICLNLFQVWIFTRTFLFQQLPGICLNSWVFHILICMPMMYICHLSLFPVYVGQDPVESYHLHNRHSTSSLILGPLHQEVSSTCLSKLKLAFPVCLHTNTSCTRRTSCVAQARYPALLKYYTLVALSRIPAILLNWYCNPTWTDLRKLSPRIRFYS